MKYILIYKYSIISVVLAVILFQFSAYPILGATDSADIKPSPTSSNSATLIDKLKKIELLKEKIATKVSELRNKEKGAISGTVNKISGNSLSLTTITGEQSITILDDALIFTMADGTKTESSIKKLSTGINITVFGYNNQSISSFEAKYIYINRITKRNTGKITDTDKSNYTITVKDLQGNITVDIETYTKIFTYNKDKGLIKAGFSKLKAGDLVFLIGTPNSKEDNRISATRIIVFSFGNPLPTITAESEATPSTTAKAEKTTTPTKP